LIITGVTYNVSDHKKTLKPTRIKLYNTLVLPALLYGSENWTITARDARITAVEKKYMEKKQWDTLGQIIKQREIRGIKYNPSFGHNIGLDKKLDMTCKQKAS
jgi:hypothetical protein